MSKADLRKSKKEPAVGPVTDIAIAAAQDRRCDLFVAAVLFALGVCQSVLYFGHQVVPNSDFPAFNLTGHQIWSGQLPTKYKWGPVVGVLQVPLGRLAGGRHPDLTGGWLLNAVLHPFSVLLFWLVGKRIIGASAVWFAIVAVINPWIVYLLTEPIAETTMLFFILLTFYFIFKNSRWGYFFASITTMVRYEGAALVLAAFVMDMINAQDKRRRISAVVCAAAASVPLALWIAGTLINWQAQGESHYFSVFTKDYEKLFSEPVADRVGFIKHIGLLWQVGFNPLLVLNPRTGAGAGGAGMVFAGGCLLFGSAYGIYRRNWGVLVLLLFFVPYFILHARYPYPLPRYHVIIFWIAVLLCMFGLQSIYGLINSKWRIPRPVVFVLQAAVLATAVNQIYMLSEYLPKLSRISPCSHKLLFVTVAAAAVISGAFVFFHSRKHILKHFAVLAAICLIAVSNHFSLVRLVGDGQRDSEFKLLADWYIANAKPGEKMAVYLSVVVKIFVPECADSFVGIPKAEDRQEFIKKCYDENITYVVWASREMLNPGSENYKLRRLDNIAFLDKPNDNGPFKFVARLISGRGWVNVFKLPPKAE